MNYIQRKIEEIRRKPEHIRIRYAWGCAASVTFLVIIIWIISLSAKNNADNITNQEVFTTEQMQSIDDLKTSGQDLKNATDKLKDSMNNVQNQQKMGTPQGMPAQGMPTQGEGFGQ